MVAFVSCHMQYISGFGNECASEDPRCPGALPEGQVWVNKILIRELWIKGMYDQPSGQVPLPTMAIVLACELSKSFTDC